MGILSGIVESLGDHVEIFWESCRGPLASLRDDVGTKWGQVRSSGNQAGLGRDQLGPSQDQVRTNWDQVGTTSKNLDFFCLWGRSGGQARPSETKCRPSGDQVETKWDWVGTKWDQVGNKWAQVETKWGPKVKMMILTGPLGKNDMLLDVHLSFIDFF